jgi:hypothetical protein
VFNLQKEKETYKYGRYELIKSYMGISTSSVKVYDMPPSYDSSIPKKLDGKVSTLNNFLESFLELMKDEYSLNKLCSIVY